MTPSSILPVGVDASLLADPTITDPSGQKFYPEPGAEPFNVTLVASETKNDLSLIFPRECDFLITGLAGVQTGTYTVQFVLPNGRQLSTAKIANASMVGTAQFPVPIWPAIRVPRGGKIGINITDTSVAGNAIQIVFYGVRLYPTS